MRGKWLQRVKAIHTWLGVFFSPLLLLFVATGWWQTFQTEDDKNTDFFNATLAKLSDIHTSDYFSAGAGGHHHASRHFQFFVAAMAVALMTTILLGLALSCQNVKKSIGTVAAFLLGILVPVLILYFN